MDTYNVKCNNYLFRTYIATESRKKGGYVGIEEDEDGYLLEATQATVGILLKNGDFVVPPFDRILPGTTAIKILDFIENKILPNKVEFKNGTSI